MKEWYLLTSLTRPNSIGGYENEAFADFKDDAFLEAIQTSIGETVILYNHDLSQKREIRCIIQANMADTLLKSLERIILAPIGTLKAGMYIFYENVYWLITGYPGNNGIYEKATLVLCQYKLKWQLDNGRIIERYANFTSASKYDIGENGNQTITLSSNNFTILVPEDDLSATLDGKRVFIDRDTINPKKVFKITRSDDVLYLYGSSHGGILSFISDKDELNMEVDRPDLGLCNYKTPIISPTPPDETEILSAYIEGNSELRIGRQHTYKVYFKDKNGEDIPNADFAWNIVSEFAVDSVNDSNEIKLLVANEDCVGSSFLLQIIYDNAVISEKQIRVVGAF
jgi:hypothetical protein